jgi:hypothetical protein
LAREDLKQWAYIEQKSTKSSIAKNSDTKFLSFPQREKGLGIMQARLSNEKEGDHRSTLWNQAYAQEKYRRWSMYNLSTRAKMRREYESWVNQGDAVFDSV